MEPSHTQPLYMGPSHMGPSHMGPSHMGPSHMGTGAPWRIVLVAGEVSGDNLGAQLIEALRARLPNAHFAGIAGPRMAAAGCEVWERIESLSVMGLFEILPHLPRLLRLRRSLLERLLRSPPDVYVGVDAKEFNLRLMPTLKARGIPTVQY